MPRDTKKISQDASGQFWLFSVVPITPENAATLPDARPAVAAAEIRRHIRRNKLVTVRKANAKPAKRSAGKITKRRRKK